MPRCEGLPSGPCPAGINDCTVKNAQSDLFLCPSCDEIRFPSTQPTTSKGNKGIKTTRRTNQTVQVQSTTADNVKCTVCEKTCARSATITCDICMDVYDQQCSTMTNAVFGTLLTIVQCTGWVCYPCRRTSKSKLESLQVKQSATIDEMAVVTSTMEQLRCDVKTIENKLQNLMQTPSAAQSLPLNPEMSDADLKFCIAKTVQDINRRDSNVIVNGLPDDSEVNDETVFTTFCEEHLSTKPCVVWSRRLGRPVNSDQSTTGRPRRLLVKLRSAEVASDLRRASRSLRRSPDETVRSVYINPDLTREQAKLAYEERQKRHASRSQQSVCQHPAGDSARSSSVRSNADTGTKQAGAADDGVPHDQQVAPLFRQ